MSVTIYACRGRGNDGCIGAYVRESEFKISVWSEKAGKWRTVHRGLCRNCARLGRTTIPGAAAAPANPKAILRMKEKAFVAGLVKP